MFLPESAPSNVSIHAPVKVRQEERNKVVAINGNVSIHAPVKVRLLRKLPVMGPGTVSIHAPVKVRRRKGICVES